VPNVSLRMRLLFAVMLGILIAGAILTFISGQWVMTANTRIIRTQGINEDLARTLSALQDTETGQRGFLLTGIESYLEPYNKGRVELQDYLRKLQGETDAGELDQTQVAELQKLAQLKLTELRQSLDARQQKGLDAALEVVRAGHGKETMDQIRSVIGGLVTGQKKKLEGLFAESKNATILRTLVFAIVAAVEILFCMWSYRRIVKEMERAQAAATETRRQKDLLSVTLMSIGDAVMVADLETRITFMNSVAETLTGWSFAEANGRRAAEVFRIVNESSRQIVESPIEKVFRLGMVVGLANHTVLIRKDGTEVPIDDSGAPIRDEDGKIYGAVLVFRDFSEHKAAEQSLMAAKAEAESASREKDQFLATLSHELRTPLAPVIATLQMWEVSDEIPAALKPDITMIRRNVDLEARLIDDLLDLTRIAKGKLSLNREIVDFHELVNSVIDIVRPETEAKAIRLTTRLLAVEHFVNGDSARMQQVMWNVFKNAVKFTGNGGTIQIETSNLEKGHLTLRVKDSGIGMTPEALARVFTPFEQGDDETTRRYGGLGLGLSIAKALAEANGGRIAAESEGPDRGSTLTISFPTENPPAAKSETIPETGLAARSLRILLVEDHADTARAMERVLTSLGHRIQTASSVQSAMTLAGRDTFDLLVSDIGLPDGTGLELVKQVRVLQPIPAIALTGFGMEEDIERCREAGFAAHLTKPINFQKLHATIQGVSAGRGT